MKPNLPIRIAIADDHVLVREGLIKTILSFGNYAATIQASDGAELIQKIENSNELPDICIIDINMPRKNGWQTLAEIRQRWNEVKVMVITSLNEDSVVRRVIKSGGNGYLCKTSSESELKEALFKVFSLGYYYPSSHSTIFYTGIADNRGNNLTQKELQFLQLCCYDTTYKEIAVSMAVSVRTVEAYRDSLFEKLNTRTRVGLVLYAIKNGLTACCLENKKIG